MLKLNDWRCKKCHHEFEALVEDGRKPPCPACGSRSVEKQLPRSAHEKHSSWAVR